MERLKRPESRRMAQPLASVEAFEGFEGFKGFEGFEAFEGQFRATRKKGFGAPEPRRASPQPAQLRPQSRRAQSPQSSKCEVLERLKRPWSV